jgi:hypothetical protein
MLIVINFVGSARLRMLRGVFILFLFSWTSGYSQSAEVSRYELSWSFFHPGTAIKVKKIKDECDRFFDKKTIQAQLDSFSNGGKLDAYRHIFYMAAFAQKVNAEKLRMLGMAHEKNNYNQFKKGGLEYGEIPDSLSTVMDLYNNELGFKLGSANKNADLQKLSRLVITEIKNGKAIVMKRKRSGTYVDCSGKEINPKLYGAKWFIPKCLVTSDTVYMD